MAERLIVFPYNIQFAPILRHKELFKGYEISNLISLNGWGLNGRDAGCADEGEYIGITVQVNFEEALERCDTVMFIESQAALDFQKVIYPRIIKAIEANKNIICTVKLCEEDCKAIKSMCSNKGVYFKCFEYNKSENLRELKEEESIIKVNTPVIYVLGISENTHKFELQLSLREKLMSAGYKVSQIGSRHYCELLGFHSFPGFIMHSGVSESNKVVKFNRLVKNIEKYEMPDLIIIGIPGGIMPFNDQFPNRFGILAYEVAHSVMPDVTILSTFYQDYKIDYFDMLSKLIRYKFGFEADCFNVANNYLDWERSKEENLLSYAVIASSFVDNKNKCYNKLERPVYNILNSDDRDKMACFCISKLAEYGKYGII